MEAHKEFPEDLSLRLSKLMILLKNRDVGTMYLGVEIR